MTTKKPRFLVTIDPDYYLALKTFAAMSRMSVSAVINEMLKPQLDPLLAIVRAARDQPEIVEGLERLKAHLDPLFGGDGNPPSGPPGASCGGPGAGGAPAGRASIRRSAKAAGAPPAPPPARQTPESNTGVTSPHNMANQSGGKPGKAGRKGPAR